ncbi:MAG: peptide deformylase [Clostridia bacterium]|nr:peptide deformylase [Clostridia bacterium]
MALRMIKKYGEEVLRKKSRAIDKIDDKILTLLDDMAETMYQNDGVGLAAPQVGILKRAVVIDIGEGLIELINPEIISSSGSQIDEEGCLSIPGVAKKVDRPSAVIVKALGRDGKQLTIKGTNLLARALCHEIDHLNGVLFIDKAIDDQDQE